MFPQPIVHVPQIPTAPVHSGQASEAPWSESRGTAFHGDLSTRTLPEGTFKSVNTAPSEPCAGRMFCIWILKAYLIDLIGLPVFLDIPREPLPLLFPAQAPLPKLLEKRKPRRLTKSRFPSKDAVCKSLPTLRMGKEYLPCRRNYAKKANHE